MKSLTWYPGTVLPHASLWHTLLRATWLNDLRKGEIAGLAEGRGGQAAKRPSSSAAAEQEVPLTAAALGERAGVFHFGTLDRLPRCLFPTHVATVLRWCPECLRMGYHTVLGSLRLVTRCPIHGSSLLEACPECKEGFRMPTRGLAVRSKLHCRCGRVELLRPQTCRQPSLSPAEARAWDPVTRWLRQVKSVTAGSMQPTEHVGLALTAQWCRDLGIAYPDCFEADRTFWSTADEAARWSSYRALSGELAGPCSPTPAGRSWTNSPTTWVYRSMARHLRRHGLRRPDRWIVGLMTSVDPVTFADAMARRPKARAAFTEMLWSRLMEPGVHERRWPIRKPPVDSSSLHTLWSIEDDPALRITTNTGDAMLPPWAHQWVSYHVSALVAARLAWQSAVRSTERSIDDRWADWSRDDQAFTGRMAWYCRPRGRRVVFAGYVRDAPSEPFACPMPDKVQRSADHHQGKLQALRGAEALAGPRCLCWDTRDGWHVAAALPPDDRDVRRARLLHVAPRTDCWIYRSSGRFVARLTDSSIQVSGTTARETFSSLRTAVDQYRRHFGADHAAAARPSPLPSAVAPYAFELSQGLMALLCRPHRKDRFWRTHSAGAAVVRDRFWQEVARWRQLGRA